MKNRHFYILILLIQISAVGLILRETPTKSRKWVILKKKVKIADRCQLCLLLLHLS